MGEWVNGQQGHHPSTSSFPLRCWAYVLKVQMNATLQSLEYILVFLLWPLTCVTTQTLTQGAGPERERGSVWLIPPAVSTVATHAQGVRASRWLLWFAMWLQRQWWGSVNLWGGQGGVGGSTGRQWGPGSRCLWPLYFRLMPAPPPRVSGTSIQWVVGNSGKNSHFPRGSRQDWWRS